MDITPRATQKRMRDIVGRLQTEFIDKYCDADGNIVDSATHTKAINLIVDIEAVLGISQDNEWEED